MSSDWQKLWNAAFHGRNDEVLEWLSKGVKWDEGKFQWVNPTLSPLNFPQSQIVHESSGCACTRKHLRLILNVCNHM